MSVAFHRMGGARIAALGAGMLVSVCTWTSAAAQVPRPDRPLPREVTIGGPGTPGADRAAMRGCRSAAITRSVVSTSNSSARSGVNPPANLPPLDARSSDVKVGNVNRGGRAPAIRLELRALGQFPSARQPRVSSPAPLMWASVDRGSAPAGVVLAVFAVVHLLGLGLRTDAPGYRPNEPFRRHRLGRRRDRADHAVSPAFKPLVAKPPIRRSAAAERIRATQPLRTAVSARPPITLVAATPAAMGDRRARGYGIRCSAGAGRRRHGGGKQLQPRHDGGERKIGLMQLMPATAAILASPELRPSSRFRKPISTTASCIRGRVACRAGHLHGHDEIPRGHGETRFHTCRSTIARGCVRI